MGKRRKRYPELNALKGRIREYGTTYRKLSADIGLCFNSLSAKLNGYQPFNCNEMEKIAELLDIEPSEICKFFLPSYCETQRKRLA